MGGVRLLFSCACCVALVACDGSVSPGVRDGGHDAASDGSTGDGSVDGSFDAAVDAAVDGALDASRDSAVPRDAAPPPACDAAFRLSRLPEAGGAFDVFVTLMPGLTNVALELSGPGSPSASYRGVTGRGPYTWTYHVSGAGEGLLSMTFHADPSATVYASCGVWVSAASDGGVADAGVVDAGPHDAGMTAPTGNRFGIGLVNGGDTRELDLAADLAGPGGYVKLLFVGVRPGMGGPDSGWVNSVRDAYARDLIPVVRFAPDWGDRRVRNQSDGGSDGLRYSQLAASYAAIVRGLPLRAGWPFYVEIHNEPNLCSEWACDRGRFPSDHIPSDRMALEYASMVRDVASALHGLGDARVRVVNGGMAPGGVRWCECVGPGEGAFEAGNTSMDYLAQMEAGVPGVFANLDAFATHSYPAEGEGWGFFVPYDRAGTGLRYFTRELTTIGRLDLPVLITETGWPTALGGTTYGSRDQIAGWTQQAYENVWLTDSHVLGVMPFMLMDSAWDPFGWASPGGTPYPVYGTIRSLRCSRIAGRCP